MISKTTKRLFVGILILFQNINIYAQTYYFEANRQFDKKNYQNAIPLFIKALNEEDSAELLEKLAYCYFVLDDFQNAEINFQKALSKKNYSPNAHRFYAEVLHKNERFEEAITHYQQFQKISPHLNSILTLKISKCKQAILWKNSYKNDVLIENLRVLNSELDESGISIGNNIVYFGSSRQINTVNNEAKDKKVEVNNFRIFASKYTQLNDLRSFKSPNLIMVDNINVNNDLAHPTINKDENIFFYTKSYSYTFGKNKFQNHEDETYTEIFIYQSTKNKNKWTEPIPTINIENINYNMLHPCLSENGNRLYFASNYSGGYGSYDIYFIEKDPNGLWSKPVNLGNIINSKEQELYPSYANDSVLYFASDGHIGVGDLDVFKAKLQNGKVISIENVGYPLNSTFNDYSFVPNASFTAGLFCSNRPGGLGYSDIYYFRMLKQ